MEELRKCWKVPYIVYFCNLFEQKLDLIDMRVDEFEDAILDDCGDERNIVVIHLIQKLLKPFINRSIDLTNYEQYLFTVLRRYGLEGLYLQQKETNAWKELSMLTKLDIIYTLCELRIQLADVEAKLTDFESNELRIEPFGVDSAGNKIWYFGDLRLYEEKPTNKEKDYYQRALAAVATNSKKSKTTKKTKKSKANKRRRSEDTSDEEDNGDDDNDDDEEEDDEDVEGVMGEDSDSTVDIEEETSRKSKKAVKKVVKNEELSKPVRQSARRKKQSEEVEVNVESVKEVEPAVVEEEIELRSTRSGRRIPIITPKPVKRVTKKRANLSETSSQVEPKVEPVKKVEFEQVNETFKEENKVEDEKIETTETIKEEDKIEVDQINQTIEQENKFEVDKVNEEIKDESKVEVKSEEIKTEEKETRDESRTEVETHASFKVEPRIEEKEEYLEELKSWRCICVKLEDWSAVVERYKTSKKRVDQEIAKKLETNYLPEMPALFQKAEREKMQRVLATAPKRQSQRIQTRQHVQSENDSNDLPSDLDSNGEWVALTEQERLAEKQRREEIARQREERLKQRLLKREACLNGDGVYTSLDENSQASSRSVNNDFNFKNYLLMQKVLSKLLMCKYAWPFKSAVSEEDAPDYNTIIQTRMDLSTVQSKVNNKAYKSREVFVNDLDLIVKNCLTYNGEDTFYGKIALKFSNYCKRWLQIFYPREISTSLEEKNRQLMKLMENGGRALSDALDAENDDEKSPTDPSTTQTTTSLDANLDSESQNGQLQTDENELIKKKRKNKVEKNGHLAEPQYVTKRTSSGRLVKMKISTDYDYTSDQELEASKKKKRVDDSVEGIQRKHRKQHSDSDSTSSLSNSDDEEFKSTIVDKQQAKLKRGPYKKRGRPKTIKALTESINQAKYRVLEEEDEEDDDLFKHNFDNDDDLDDENSNDSDLSKLNLTKLNNSTKFFRRLTGLHEPSSTTETQTGDKLTFEQYVKKLTGNLQPGNKNQPTRLSFKINPAPSSTSTQASSSTPYNKQPLTIPIINPAIKAALNKLNTPEIQTVLKPPTVNTLLTQPQNKTVESGINKNSTVKIITVNSPVVNSALNTTASSLANKKFVITSPSLNTTTTSTPNLVKIINISQFANGIKSNGTSLVKPQILTPILNRPLIMLNNPSSLVKGSNVLTAIPITNIGHTSLASPNTSSLSTTNVSIQNSVNILVNESDKQTTPDNNKLVAEINVKS